MARGPASLSWARQVPAGTAQESRDSDYGGRSSVSDRPRRLEAAGTMGCCTGRCSLICLCVLQLVSVPDILAPIGLSSSLQ